MKFPNNWSEDCPPQDAVEADGVVYRVVKNLPPDKSDLASHLETGKLPTAPACLRCGLSVFRDQNDAEHQKMLLPKLGKWIAKATLNNDHGKTKLTDGKLPTHTTWWPYENVVREALFTIEKEG